MLIPRTEHLWKTSSNEGSWVDRRPSVSSHAGNQELSVSKACLLENSMKQASSVPRDGEMLGKQEGRNEQVTCKTLEKEKGTIEGGQGRVRL